MLTGCSMETKNKSGSGIGRIFSLSLNQAIMSKRSTSCTTDKSSRHISLNSPESEKDSEVKVKYDQLTERPSTHDLGSGHGPGSAYKQNTVKASVEREKNAATASEQKSIPIQDCWKGSHHVNLTSSTEAKRKPDSTARNIPVSKTLELKDASHTHIHKEMESRSQTGISSQTSNHVRGTSESGDTGPYGTLFSTAELHSCVERIGSSTVSARPHTRPLSKSSSEKNGSRAKNIRSNCSYERHAYSRTSQTVGGKTEKSPLKGQSFKTSTQRKDNYTRSKGSASAEHLSEQSAKKWADGCKSTRNKNGHGIADLVSNSATSKTDRAKKYPCLAEAKSRQFASTNSVSIGEKNGDLKDSLPRSDAANIVTKSKRNPQSVLLVRGVDSADAEDGKSRGASRANSACQKINDNSDLPPIISQQDLQRAESCETSRLSTESERPPTVFDTSSGDCQTPGLLSSPAFRTGKWYSQTHVRNSENQEIKTDIQEILVELSKKQAQSQTESTENTSLSILGVEKLKPDFPSEVFSNSDKSEMDVWFDVKDDINEKKHSTEAWQSMDSSVYYISAKKIKTSSDVELEEASAECSLGKDVSLVSVDKKIETERTGICKDSGVSDVKDKHAEAQPVNPAKMRQASVTTRMRGNRRLKSYNFRINMPEKDLLNSSEVNKNEGIYSESTATSDCEQLSSEKNVNDRQMTKVKYSETVQRQTENGNLSDKISGEKNIQECVFEVLLKQAHSSDRPGVKILLDCFPEKLAEREIISGDLNSNRNMSEACSHGNLDDVNGSCLKNAGSECLDAKYSLYGRNSTLLEPCVKLEEQLICGRPSSADLVSEAQTFTQRGQDSVPEKNCLYSACFKKRLQAQDYQEEYQNKPLKQLSSLMSLRPRPTPHLLNSVEIQELLGSDQESAKSSDSSLAVAQHHQTYLGNLSVGHGTESKFRSIVSSSSPASLSSINNQNKNVSSSATSYTSLSSDNSRDGMTRGRKLDLSRKVNSCTDGVSKFQKVHQFRKAQKFVLANGYNSVVKSQSSADLQAEITDDKQSCSDSTEVQVKSQSSADLQAEITDDKQSCSDSTEVQDSGLLKYEGLNILQCPKVSVSEEREKETSEVALPQVHSFHTTELHSQPLSIQSVSAQECILSSFEEIKTITKSEESQLDKVIICHGKNSASSSVDPSSCEETKRDMLPVHKLEKDACRCEIMNRISCESSTETVTEATEKIKLQNDDINNSQPSSVSVADSGESVSSLDVNWDSDNQVLTYINSSEPPVSCYCDQQKTDSGRSADRFLKYDITTEKLQLHSFDCEQGGKKSRFRKHRPDPDCCQTQHEKFDMSAILKEETFKEQTAVNKHCQVLKSSGTNCRGRIPGSKFKSKGHHSTVMKSIDSETSRGGNMKTKQHAKEIKYGHNDEQSYSSFRSRKEQQDFPRKISSTSSSGCSESFSVISDYLPVGCDLYMQESDSRDSRCRTWVGKTGKWPVRTEKDCVYSSDSNSCPSGIHHLCRQPQAADQCSVFGTGVSSGTDISQSHKPLSSMSVSHARKERVVEKKLCGQSVHHHHKQTHSKSGSTQFCGKRVHCQKVARRGCMMLDSDDPHSQAATDRHTRESGVLNLKTSLHQRHKGHADSKSAYSKPINHSQSEKKSSCSESVGNHDHREHHHSVSDLSSTKILTSSSSDYGVDVLSQSDYDDLPAQMQMKVKINEAHGNHPETSQSGFENVSREFWPELFENIPCYQPYTSQSQSQSQSYSPFHPEASDFWVPTHHHYYEQWYNAWMAYCMGYYGYGFQEQDQATGFNKEHRGQNCGCNSAVCHQAQSRPPSKPTSLPLRPASTVDNPSLQDQSVSCHDTSLIQSERIASQQYLSRDGCTGSTGTQDMEGFGMYSHPFKAGGSTCHPQDCTQRYPVDTSNRPLWMKKEDKDLKGHVLEDKNCLGEIVCESRNVQNDSVIPDSQGSAYTGDEFNCISQTDRQSMNFMGGCLWRYHPRNCSSSQFAPRPDPRHYQGDCSWPGRFSNPGLFPSPCRPPMMVPPLHPFRFTVPPPLPYPACSPQLATTTLSYRTGSCNLDGKDDVREGPSCLNYPSEQQSYPECREFPPYSLASMLSQDVSRDWAVRQTRLPLLSAPRTPPRPPPPLLNYAHPSPQEKVPASCGLEMTSSKPSALDSSFDTLGEYDASCSDQETVGLDAVKTKRKRPAFSETSFNKFVAVQKERYLQMYKDSGSDDLDCNSLPSSTASKVCDTQEENDLSGNGVISKCRENSGKSLLHSLHRRAIPTSRRGRNRRSCPAVVESITGTTFDIGLNCGVKKEVSVATGIMTPPAKLSYAQAVSSPGVWWDISNRPDMLLCKDDFPALSSSSSLSQDCCAKTTSKNSTPQEEPSFTDVREDGTCKNFFRNKSFFSVDQHGAVSIGGQGMSRYASRLLNDSRLSGPSKWGRAAREAFSKPYQTSFVDTHCHLDFLFDREPYSGSFASYREKNKNTFPNNFEGCVAVFCKPRTFRIESKWKPLAEEAGVWMAMGCHPKNACEYNEWTEMGLRHALKHKKTVALGEIGLDYSKHNGQSSGQQKEVFIRQIKIALEMKLPLVIHCREAEDDCLEILEEHVPADYKIHCHCFTSDYESATKWISRFKNMFIGLTPLVTYRSAMDTHQVARHLPLNKLLLETDAPYFLPPGFEGEGISRSHPGMALMVAIRVAELRGIRVEEVLTHVRRNTRDMYGI